MEVRQILLLTLFFINTWLDLLCFYNKEYPLIQNNNFTNLIIIIESNNVHEITAFTINVREKGFTHYNK